MSIEYDALLERHRVNVKTGYSWIRKYMPEILESGYDYDWYINAHDLSKRNKDEYYACDAFIFGDRNDIIDTEIRIIGNSGYYIRVARNKWF